ncbi:MAG: MMPL family transporter [Actinomycetota bacterium]|nr:MMPL family transporter [Actinomycetota bacterium]
MNTSGDRSFFYRLGSWCASKRWIVLAIWIIAIGAVGPQAAKLQDRLSQGGFEVAGSQSDQVKQSLAKDFTAQHQFNDLVVFHSQTLDASEARFKQVVAASIQALRKGRGVASVTDPFATPQRSVSKDGHTAIATASLSESQDEVLKHTDALQRAVDDASRGSGVEVLLTGGGPFYSEFSKTTTHDLERAEKVAFPITLVILVIAFASVVAAGVPLVLALISLFVSFGLISLLASATTVSLFTQNIASMIGIGVGIDYSLFILTRYREESRAGRDRNDAIAEAIATSGKAVFVSALTVVVALSGTLLVKLPAFRSMGAGSMIAVFFAGAAALTLLPALLAVLGKGVNALSFSRRTAGGETGGMWRRWAHFIMRRPVAPLIISITIIALLASPVRSLRLGSSGPSILPASSGPRRALELTASAFGSGQIGPIVLVVKADQLVTGPAFKDIFALSDRLASDKEVASVTSIATLVPGVSEQEAQQALRDPRLSPFAFSMIAKDSRSTTLTLVSKHQPNSAEVQSLINRLRGTIARNFPSLKIAVGGDPALNHDINEEVTGALPSVVGLVLVLSFIVLMLFLRSILLPLKAILMNLASVLAAYGLVVFVFQQGHGQTLLGFKSEGIVESFLPLFLFCILFGLSMDYEVFLLARIREEYLKTKDNTEAVGWGLEHTARIITSAAAVMVTVFGAFALARLIPIKAMGFGLAAAVFLDATIIRIVLVPATMRLLGDLNWWMPKWLDRLLPSITFESHLSPEPDKSLV